MCHQVSIVCRSCNDSVGAVDVPPNLVIGDDEILSRLRDYHPPTVAEASDVRLAVQGDREALASLDEDISTLEDIMDTLQQRRLDKALSMKRKSSLFAPIRRLPNELLAEIFRLVCEPGHFSTFRGTADFPALTISQVCHIWRAFVQNTPRLWSGVFIKLDSGVYQNYYPQVDTSEVSSLYLERSRDHPLQVEIRAEDFWDMDDIFDCEHETIWHLMENMSRWEQATLINTDATLLLQSGQQDLPCLRSLTVSKDAFLESNYRRMDRILDAPNLEHLDLIKVSLEQCPLRWDSLQRLNVDFPDHTSLRGVLYSLAKVSTGASRLVYMRCRYPSESYGDPPLDPRDEPIRFDKLEVLDINRKGILPEVLAPKLRCLDLSSIDYECNLEEDVSNFLNKSRVALLVLKIADSFLLEKMLSLAPKPLASLQELDCHDLRDQDVFLVSRLFVQDLDLDNSSYLPELTQISLRLRSSYSWEELAADLLNVFESRRRCESPKLKTVFLAYKIYTHSKAIEHGHLELEGKDEVKSRFQHLCDDGLSLCMNGNWSPLLPRA